MTTYQKLVLRLLIAIMARTLCRTEAYLTHGVYTELRQKHIDLIQEAQNEIEKEN